MGGKSSSSSSSSSETKNTWQTISEDRRIAATDNAQVIQSGGPVTLYATDNGAVNAALDLAKTSSQTEFKSMQEAFGFGRDALSETSDALKVVARGQNDIANNVVDRSFGLATKAMTSVSDAGAREENILSQTAKTLSDAYETSRNIASNNETLIKTGLVVVGVVGAVALWRR